MFRAKSTAGQTYGGTDTESGQYYRKDTAAARLVRNGDCAVV